jgi:phosphatidylserine decarboxylase
MDELIIRCFYEDVTVRAVPARSSLRDDIGFLLSNHIPRQLANRFFGWFSQIVSPLLARAGETCNVNTIALNRIPKLFCKNERAVISTTLRPTGIVVTLVPEAAILVASIRLHFLDVLLNSQYRSKSEIPCRTPLRKGEEMGWFQHGSTLIVFAPKEVALCDPV